MTRPSILLATLGATWQVVPEIVAALSPEKCPLYHNHPDKEDLFDIGRQCGVEHLDELWIITSSSQKTRNSFDKIIRWNARLRDPLIVRFFAASKTDQVTTPKELRLLRELIFRVVLHANERGHVVCSLAGGRKTMSADLQHAASLFGAKGLLHIVAPEPLPELLKSDCSIFWSTPLLGDIAAGLLPAYIGNYARRDSMDALLDSKEILSAHHYPLPNMQQGMVIFRHDGNSLVGAAERRERDAQRLLSNYLAGIAQSERHENWRHLYRLSPSHIQLLRQERLCARHEGLIRKLPKAELHCHLGGILTLTQQITVGKTIWASISDQRKIQLQSDTEVLLQQAEWPWNWPQHYLRSLDSPVLRAEMAAAILTLANREQLEWNLYGCTEPRRALKTSSPNGFSAYERPGELSGSALLGHPEALSSYVDSIKQYVAADNICYLELRGSPHKYMSENPSAWLARLHKLLANDDRCIFRFIWILDRRQNNIEEPIAQALAAKKHKRLEHFLVGLDVAGDEIKGEPQSMAAHFMPAFRDCLPITIHAGEGESAENIWQAAYYLHADRIGHGLTLADNHELLTRFRNRGICLELCPTSNQEVIGFRDTEMDPATADYTVYPISALWRNGVDITINTDNPGISKTNLTQEYLIASRISEDPLSLWDILAMIKQGFVHALTDSETRESMLKQYDKDIFNIIQCWLLDQVS